MAVKTTKQQPRRSNDFVRAAMCLLLCLLSYQVGVRTGLPVASRPSIAASSTATVATSFELAKTESMGFFDDISDREWMMLQERARAVYPNTMGNPRKGMMTPAKWFQNHYEPDFACRHERRIGRLGDGGKWICDPHRIANQETCLVYSVGSNGDASFEAAVQKEIGTHCEIHVFDFGDYNRTVVEQAPGANYHRWGIDKETSGKFKTLQETVKDLGHMGRTIDLFKIDCEGCELDTASHWLQANVTLRQILVEVHGENGDPGTMRNPAAMDMFELLERSGYRITHKEPNIAFWRFRKCVEFAFLKLSPSFMSTGAFNSTA